MKQAEKFEGLGINSRKLQLVLPSEALLTFKHLELLDP